MKNVKNVKKQAAVSDKAQASSVVIHNKISTNYRPLHVDGAYGGVTPHGL